MSTCERCRAVGATRIVHTILEGREQVRLCAGGCYASWHAELERVRLEYVDALRRVQSGMLGATSLDEGLAEAKTAKDAGQELPVLDLSKYPEEPAPRAEPEIVADDAEPDYPQWTWHEEEVPGGVLDVGPNPADVTPTVIETWHHEAMPDHAFEVPQDLTALLPETD